MPEENRAAATGNTYRKLGEVRTYRGCNMRTDRQTARQTNKHAEGHLFHHVIQVNSRFSASESEEVYAFVSHDITRLLL